MTASSILRRAIEAAREGETMRAVDLAQRVPDARRPGAAYGEIEAPRHPLVARAANVAQDVGRRVEGSPGQFFLPGEGVGNWLNKLAYGQEPGAMDRIGAAGDLADIVPGGGAALGIFGGIAAKRADTMMADIAQKMKAAGRPRDEIWDKTGWFEGPDQKWRFEIDDSQASRVNPMEENMPAGWAPENMGEYMHHDGLFDAYPDIKSTRLDGESIGASGGFDQALGAYNPDLDMVYLNARGDSSFPVALHETQHAIQEREGFAKGGSMSEFVADFAGKQRIANDEIKALNAQMQEVSKQRDDIARNLHKMHKGVKQQAKQRFDALGQQYGALMEKRSSYIGDAQIDPRQEAYNRYRSLAGEVEARNVEERITLTPDQRRATPPWMTQDIPDEKQIVRMK